jgi:transcription antitermination factor NusG
MPVEDHEIDALQRVVESRSSVEPWSGVRAGQEVEIAAGPLTGVRGVLLRVGTNNRLVITVRLLQRSVAVEIDQDSVVAVPSYGCVA